MYGTVQIQTELFDVPSHRFQLDCAKPIISSEPVNVNCKSQFKLFQICMTLLGTVRNSLIFISTSFNFKVRSLIIIFRNPDTSQVSTLICEVVRIPRPQGTPANRWPFRPWPSHSVTINFGSTSNSIRITPLYRLNKAGEKMNPYLIPLSIFYIYGNYFLWTCRWFAASIDFGLFQYPSQIFQGYLAVTTVLRLAIQ